jgi:hypothetical protein
VRFSGALAHLKVRRIIQYCDFFYAPRRAAFFLLHGLPPCVYSASPVRPCWVVCKSMNYRFMGLFLFYHVGGNRLFYGSVIAFFLPNGLFVSNQIPILKKLACFWEARSPLPEKMTDEAT